MKTSCYRAVGLGTVLYLRQHLQYLYDVRSMTLRLAQCADIHVLFATMVTRTDKAIPVRHKDRKK